MADSPQLEHDLERLTDALWSAVAPVIGGGRSAELCKQLGDEAVALRHGTLAGGRREFSATIAALDEDQLEGVARAHALDCHLMNTAEERERLRALRDPRRATRWARRRDRRADRRRRTLNASFARAVRPPRW